MKQRPEKKILGDVACCDDPPHACPRRYCSTAMRSFQNALAEKEPKRSKRPERKSARKKKG